MRQLAFLRHAKSSWSDPELSDRLRPLNDRGLRDAPQMGARLTARKLRPSLILTSPATRALATAKEIAKAVSYPLEFLQHEDELYLASPATLREVVARQDDRFQSLLLVGHNPGLTEICNVLLPTLDLANLPTAGVVALRSSAIQWADVDPTNSELDFFDYPKNPDAIIIEN